MAKSKITDAAGENTEIVYSNIGEFEDVPSDPDKDEKVEKKKIENNALILLKDLQLKLPKTLVILGILTMTDQNESGPMVTITFMFDNNRLNLKSHELVCLQCKHTSICFWSM